MDTHDASDEAGHSETKEMPLTAEEIRAKNIARVTFPRLPVKKIVSYHASTILAADEPEIELSPEVLHMVQLAFREQRGERVHITRPEVDDLMLHLFPLQGDAKKALLKEIVSHYLAPEFLEIDSEAMDEAKSQVINAENFLRFFCKFYAPAFYYGQHLRMYAGRDECSAVQRLLIRGCSINTANGEGLTALHYAVEKNRVSMVETLLQMHQVALPPEPIPTAPPAVTSAPAPTGKGAARSAAAVEVQPPAAEPVIQRSPLTTPLLHLALHLGATDVHGWTALHVGVHHNSLACVQLLLAQQPALTKALVLETTKHSRKTALHLAAAQNRTAFIPLLLNNHHLQANKHDLLVYLQRADSTGATARHVAAFHGHTALYMDLTQRLQSLLNELIDSSNSNTGRGNDKGAGAAGGKKVKRKSDLSSATSSTASLPVEGSSAGVDEEAFDEVQQALRVRDQLDKRADEYLEIDETPHTFV